MKKSLIFFVTFIIVGSSLKAQFVDKDTSNTVDNHHNIGLSASTLSGLGLSYRYAFTKRLQLQLNGIALLTKEGDNDSWFFGSLGAELQIGLPIKSAAYGIERIYGILGFSYNFTDDQNEYSSSYYGSSSYFGTTNTEESMFTSGIGLGLQTPTFYGLHFTLNVNYFYRNTTRDANRYDKVTNEWGTTPLPSVRDITLGAGIGMYFAF